MDDLVELSPVGNIPLLNYSCTPLIAFSRGLRSSPHLSSLLSNKVFEDLKMKVDDPMRYGKLKCHVLNLSIMDFPHQDVVEHVFLSFSKSIG